MICLEQIVDTPVYPSCCKVMLHSECYNTLKENGFKCPFHSVKPKQKSTRPYSPSNPILFFVYSIVAFVILIPVIACVYVDEWTRRRFKDFKL